MVKSPFDPTMAIASNDASTFRLSPEQLSGLLKLKDNINISHESIYRYICTDKKNGGTIHKNLRRMGKKYNHRGALRASRGMIPNIIGIECRPSIVDMKTRVGDYEAEIIFLRLISGAKADETALVIVKRLSPVQSHAYTITSDNGKEFAKHEAIAEILDLDFYFAQPYHSWE